MRKISKIGICLLLCLCMAVPVMAQEPGKTELISSEREFLEFAENCRLDSYSRNLTVRLLKDIDLEDAEFEGIPVFCGIFLGEGHTIRGVKITAHGESRGFFRFLTETAEVSDLTVCGTVHPQGDSSQVGGIAGENAGTIRNCTFQGELSGKVSVGGIAGVNISTGVVENCLTHGTVHGNHFVGGIAGTSQGVIRSCTNGADINTTEQQNDVELSDITLEAVTGSESANTATDVGGIAGNSTGVIRNCENWNSVGYPHMGYNIGGIAGSQSGFLNGCLNHGTVCGRKDVGGIVGQMEPVTKISFETDTLQVLQEQLQTMAGLTGQLAGNLSGSVAGLSSQVDSLKESAQSAKDAVDALVPDVILPELAPDMVFPPEIEIEELPDMDTVIAQQNILSSSVSSMMGTLEDISASSRSTAASLSQDMQNVMYQAGAVGETLKKASENLGIQINDVSDADTEEDTTGKDTGCKNLGAVSGDLNIGGIAGAVAIENDLDHEDDLEFLGERSMNLNSQLRAVVLGCENQGEITARHRNAGGIAGWQLLGLVRNCTNMGTISSENAENIGGISGSSTGFIRNCCAKSRISGTKNVGGIAGSASIVTDCRSLTDVESGVEKVGAVIGSIPKMSRQTENAVSGNLYAADGTDPGGIDGVSYEGQAEPVSAEELSGFPDVPEKFFRVTVRFVNEDVEEICLTVPFNGRLKTDDIPPVPEKDGNNGVWDGLEDTDLTHIVFDQTFHASYELHSSTIRSTVQRDDGRSVLVARGDFTDGQELAMEPMEQGPTLSEHQDRVELWKFSLPEGSTGTYLHYGLPEDTSPADCRILVRDTEGTWREPEAVTEGSYLIVPIAPGDDGICLAVGAQNRMKILIPAACGLAAVILLTAVLLIVRRKKKKASAQQPDEETPEVQTE